MNKNEEHYAELAYWIAVAAATFNSEVPGENEVRTIENFVFDDFGESDREWVSRVLVRLGILKRIDGSPTQFSFIPNASEIRATATANIKSGPLLTELVAVIYIYCTNYGLQGKLDKEFLVEESILPLFQTLSELGFAVTTPDGFCWTEKIKQPLEAHYRRDFVLPTTMVELAYDLHKLAQLAKMPVESKPRPFILKGLKFFVEPQIID
ncbi:MAG: hypothetical protein WBB16_04480 [Aestuariivirga sp.]